MVAGRASFGLLCLDHPFHRALSGALLGALETDGIEPNLVVLLRPRTRFARLLRGQIGRREWARFVSTRFVGRPAAARHAPAPLGLDGYARLVGRQQVQHDQDRFASFLAGHQDRTYVAADLHEPATLEVIRRSGIRWAFSEGCGLLRRPLLDVVNGGVINLHASGPLPRYRGLGSLEFAVLDRAPIVMTLHLIDAGIDTGPILAERALSRDGATNLEALYALAMRESREFIATTVAQVLDGAIVPRPQPPGEGRQYFEPHPFISELADRRLRG